MERKVYPSDITREQLEQALKKSGQDERGGSPDPELILNRHHSGLSPSQLALHTPMSDETAATGRHRRQQPN